ncbi:MAG TPA: cupin domain-containing protein [Paraburkholderia sp.]|jgi:gentisate 1,2-dioxygenase|nr:cupin domain-containing protein [Paraburkholderia sp.]
MSHTAPAEVDFDSAPDLPALHELLELVQMKNGWAKPTPSLYPQPKQVFVPAHWRYRDARAALHAAGRLVGTEWAERRNLIMANPIPGNDYATVRTLVGAYQMIKGHESARSHRHTPNAMRVVLEGSPDMYTIVDGVKIPMLAGDILLTPNGCYHGHLSESDQEGYWIDFLDAPLVQHLGPMFFEIHPDALEKGERVDPRSPMRFAYADYRPRVADAAEIAAGVRALELGPPQLVTFDRVVLQLAAGTQWQCARSTANRIFTVIEGEGTTQVANRSFDWRAGDMFALPSWYEYRIDAGKDALLLRVSDEPLMRMLDWYRVDTTAPF